MKEIWKLIELLNEYETPRSWVVYKSYDDYDWFFYWVDCDWETEIAWSDSLICSKNFWWIWWLVENDKIDFDKCWLDVRHYLSYNKRYDKWIVMAKNYDYDTFVVEEFYPPYEQLLMLLSIQDNPIEFLISVLK